MASQKIADAVALILFVVVGMRSHVRSPWVGPPHGVRIFVFLGIGLVFTLAFLLAGRALVALALGRSSWRRRRADSHST